MTGPADPNLPGAERAARAVMRRLREAGFRAYFAGGCVRDRLRGEQPTDFDVATDASAEAVQQLFRRTVPVGAQFGVVMVSDRRPAGRGRHLPHRRRVPSTAAARSACARPRRRRTRSGATSPSTACSATRSSGAVLDYVGGQADLAARVIRAIGDPAARFHEDRLRMLRAVRFAARFGYAIEPATFRGHPRPRRRDHRHRLGAHRRRGRAHPHRRRRAARLRAARRKRPAARTCCRRWRRCKASSSRPTSIPRATSSSTPCCCSRSSRQPSETLALGALLHDIAKPDCAERRGDADHVLRPRRGRRRAAVRSASACAAAARCGSASTTWCATTSAWSTRRRCAAARCAACWPRTGIDELLELARIDTLASHKDLRAYEFCIDARARLGNEPRQAAAAGARTRSARARLPAAARSTRRSFAPSRTNSSRAS